MAKLIKCKDCDKEISRNAKSCPNCGAKIKKNKIIKIIIFTVIFFSVIGIINSMPETTTESTKKESSKTTKKENLELLEWNISRGAYGVDSIIGKVKNNKNKDYTYIQIQFNLYDAEGAQVGTALANINNLEANGLWKFDAICTAPFKTAKLAELTGI